MAVLIINFYKQKKRNCTLALTWVYKITEQLLSVSWRNAYHQLPFRITLSYFEKWKVVAIKALPCKSPFKFGWLESVLCAWKLTDLDNYMMLVQNQWKLIRRTNSLKHQCSTKVLEENFNWLSDFPMFKWMFMVNICK